jgi:hypothetical protein
MTPEQVGQVEGLYNMNATGADGKGTTLGKAYDKEWKLAKDVLSAAAARSTAT